VTFRSRLLLAFVVAALVPLVLLGAGVRKQLTARLSAQHVARVQALARVAEQDLNRESESIAARLSTLIRSAEEDNRLRLALRGAPEDRTYLLDYAERAMRLSSLSMLQVQNEEGRILSSGHFRNEFDRLEPELPRLLATAHDAGVLVRVRAPEGDRLVLARLDSMRIGDRRFTLVGGIAVDRPLLARFARDGELRVTVITPRDTIASDSGPVATSEIAADVPLRFADTGAPNEAQLVPARIAITHSTADLELLHRDVNRWLIAALLTATAAALGLGVWLSTTLSRPLDLLAQATAQIDLDGPDIELATARNDEIGMLARRLGGLSRRVRASAGKLRDAERRATVGDMARQVNHDIKNGLIPIRNVLRHLSQVQEQQPETLASVFAERRSTLESSVGYLDTLARSYARLTPKVESRAIDANAIVLDVTRSAATGAVTINTELADGLPPVLADPVVLRRILENLLRNAVESLPPAGGTVTVETRRSDDSTVRFTIADTGRGMTEHEMAHAFDDFFTTKEGGTGLGLSVVRRLTADLNGALRIDSAPARGTTVTIDVPARAR
jgi:signal transduction histidine kinase